MDLLERASYLAELDGLLRQAAAGHGHLLFLGGEAGVDKSALVRHFADQVRSTTRVLAGSCDPLSTPRPLGPLIDIGEQTGGDIATLLQQSSTRSELFKAVLAELSSERATLIIIEDAHWADEATLDLIRHLGRRLGPIPALVVVTYRDDEVGGDHPLRRVLGDLATAGAVRRLALQPLSLASVTELAQHSTIDPIQLYLQTGGNPFYVTEVLALDEPGVPVSVRDAVLARASRLSQESRQVLDACTVIGSPIEPWLLQSVISTTGSISECVDLGILTGAGSNLAFRHELARQAVLETIDPVSRLVLHRRVLAALRDRTSEDPARLAHHAEEAGDREAVLTYAMAAGLTAASLSAHREAAAQYGRTLRFAQDQPATWRADLLKALSRECSLTDQTGQALASVEAELALVRELDNPLRQGDALLRKAGLLWRIGNNEQADEAVSRAIEILEPLPPSKELAATYSARSGLLMVAWRDEEAIRWGEQAIALARHLGETETVIQALNNVGSARTTFDDPRGDEELKQSLELALQHRFEDQAGRAYSNLASSYCFRYKFFEADQVLSEGIPFCAEHDLDSHRLYLLSWQAYSLMAQGRWTEAADLATSLLHHASLAPVSKIVALTTLGRIRVYQGNPGADAILDEALELALPTGELQRLGPVRTARAESAWLAGDLDQVLAEIHTIHDDAMRSQARWMIGQVAFWRWRAGDLTTPPDNAFEPFALQISGRWKEAAVRWRELGCPYETASALADSDDESDLRYALSEFQRLGARLAAAIVSARLGEMTERRIRRGLPRAEPLIAPPETRYAKSGDVHIAFQIVGDGLLDLVFVMGWVSNMELFWEGPSARFLKRLASFSRLILFDKRGTGLSDRVTELPALEQRMDDVRAVMDEVNSGQAALFGISEGAAMCALFAATYPQRTDALVIYGGYAKRLRAPDYPWAPTPMDRQKFFDAIEHGWGGVVDLDTLAPSTVGDDRFCEWWATYLRRSASPGAALALAKMNTEIDIRQVLPAIRVPTLILHRTGDLDIDIGGARYMAERIPGSEYVELPGVDHLAFAGDQDSILDEVELFLTGARLVRQTDRVLATVAVEVAVSLEREANLTIRNRRLLLDALVRETRDDLVRFRGDWIRSTDGGFLAAFDGPGRAIRFAGAVGEIAHRLDIQIRAGLHTGECDRSDGELTGMPLRYATGIMARAMPGEVIVSSTVKDLVAGSGIEFDNIGQLLVEDLLGELTLYQVIRESRQRVASPATLTQKAVRDLDPSSRLSRRETQIAILIAGGLSNREIAGELSISPATAERHVSNIFNKLGYHSRAQIAAWAVEHDLTARNQ